MAVTVLCFPPTGVLAMAHSFRCRQRYAYGDFTGAVTESRRARDWVLASLALGVGLQLGLLALFFFAGAASTW